MFRFTGSALALLVAFSLMPPAYSEAGERSERHRIMKPGKFRMSDRSRLRHQRSAVRVVSRNVVVVNVGGKSRHRRSHAYGTYSGGVDIYSRNGVGQWSYGAGHVEGVTMSVAPSAKIIDVGSLKNNDACDMQAGVCVIRP